MSYWAEHAKKQNWPPTPSEHLHFFLSSIEDYAALERAHPLGTSPNAIGPADDDPQRWVMVLHIAVLRKYFAANDVLFLGNVVAAMQECAVPIWPWTDNVWADAIRDFPDIEDRATYEAKDLEPIGERVLLRDETYGRFLHGDYSKRVAAQRRHPMVSDNSVFKATLHQSYRLRQVSGFLKDRIDQGLLVLDDRRSTAPDREAFTYRVQ